MRLVLIVLLLALVAVACSHAGEPAVDDSGRATALRIVRIDVDGRLVPCVVMEQAGYAGGAISCDWDR